MATLVLPPNAVMHVPTALKTTSNVANQARMALNSATTKAADFASRQLAALPPKIEAVKAFVISAATHLQEKPSFISFLNCSTELEAGLFIANAVVRSEKMGIVLKGAHITRVIASVAFKSLPMAALPIATIRAARAFSFLHEAYLTFKGEINDEHNVFDRIFFASKEVGTGALEIFFPVATMLADTFAMIDFVAQHKLSAEVYSEFKVVKAGLQKAALAAFASELFGFTGFDSVGSKFNSAETFAKFLKNFFK